MVKIGLERVDIQEEIMVEVLLNSGAIGLVMSSEFAGKQEFKLKKIERSIYVRNVDGSFNKEGPIEHMVEVNIYYQGHKERMEIDVIGGQILQLIPQGCNMEIGLGYDDMISCAKVVLVSTSCSRYSNLALSLLSSYLMSYNLVTL